MGNNFYKNFTFLRAQKTDLPFTMGGISQTCEQLESKNNQDAMILDVDNKAILAIIADGCSSPSCSDNHVSINEIGANLSCLIARNCIRNILRKYDLKDTNAFLYALAKSFLGGLKNVYNGIFSYKEDFQYIYSNLLSSTLLCFIVTKEHYLLFTVGDGIIAINGRIENLEEEEGIYPVQKIGETFARKDALDTLFKVRSFGETCSLESLMIATDGFQDFLSLPGEPLATFFSNSNRMFTPGYDPAMFLEFRKRIFRYRLDLLLSDALPGLGAERRP